MVGKVFLLPALPLTFNKLNDGTSQSMSDAPGEHAEGRGTFPLTVSCQNNKQVLIHCRLRNSLIDMFLLALHCTLVPLTPILIIAHLLILTLFLQKFIRKPAYEPRLGVK